MVSPGAEEKDELAAVAGQPVASLSGAGLLRYLQSARSPGWGRPQGGREVAQVICSKG